MDENSFLRFGTPLEIPLQYYRFLDAKFTKPVGEVVPELDGLVIAQTVTGYPVSVIREDDEYLTFLAEGNVEKIQCAQAPRVPEANWSLRGGQSPTPFNLRVLRKNLETLKQPGELRLNQISFDGAMSIMIEELTEKGCSGFKELTEQEALVGTPDGALNPLNMKTAVGACIKLGDSKERAYENAPGLMVEMQRDDYDSIINFERRPYAWFSKTSLKDARLDDEKISQDKGRIFQAQSTPVSVTGRRLIGDFLARFARACKRGGFFGVIGFILSRGGWHELLSELTERFEELRVKEVFPGDVSKWDKNWLHFWHWMLMELLGTLASSETHAERINRHYDRVIRAPTLVAILGLIFVMTKVQPSGDIATIVFNTIVLTFQYVMAYCEVAPKEFWSARECFGNMTLKAGGDDSISTLSTQMRSWLGHAGLRWPDFIKTVFLRSGWTIVLEETTLMNAEFMGYGSTLATDPQTTGVKFLPALPLNTTMSINQWFKISKNRDVPEMTKFIMRYSAAAEKAFPHIFSQDPDAQEYVKIAWGWLRKIQQEYWEDPCPLVQSAARGIPSISAISELYFGYPVPLYVYNGKY